MTSEFIGQLLFSVEQVNTEEVECQTIFESGNPSKNTKKVDNFSFADGAAIYADTAQTQLRM